MPQCGRPPQLAHHGLDLAERRLEAHALEHVDGDVGGLARVRGREQGVVAGREAQLDRERDRVALEDLRARRAPPRRRARAAARTPSPRSARAAGWRRRRRTRPPARAARPPRPASRLRRGIVRGARRATRLSSPKTWLSSTTSCSHSRRGRRGVGRRVACGCWCASARVGECGNVNNSKWSLPSTCSSSSPSTSSSGSGRSTAWRRKAGTQRSVTAATTPSAPSPTRAARSSSPPSTVSSRAVGEHELHRLDARRRGCRASRPSRACR